MPRSIYCWYYARPSTTAHIHSFATDVDGTGPAPQQQEGSQDPGRAQAQATQGRWKIERLFAWLHNFWRLVVRYERLVENYLGLVRLRGIVTL